MGGFGREVACMINKINQIEPIWNLVGFFDDAKPHGVAVSHFGICLGGIEDLNNWKRPIAVALCFGDPSTIDRVRNKITNPAVEFPNLIDPSFRIADPVTFEIGIGNIIKSDCIVTTEVKIGNFNIFNSDVCIGHDSQIGDCNAFMPGVRISGEVHIGNRNLFGADSFIKQQIHIGDEVKLSPLSALLTKPKNGAVYIGNPAKIFKF